MPGGIEFLPGQVSLSDFLALTGWVVFFWCFLLFVCFVYFVLSLIPARYRKPAISSNSHILFSSIHLRQFECHLLFGFVVLFSSSSCFISPICVLHFLHYRSYCSLDWVVPVEMYNLSNLSTTVFSSIFNFSLRRTITSSQQL